MSSLGGRQRINPIKVNFFLAIFDVGTIKVILFQEFHFKPPVTRFHERNTKLRRASIWFEAPVLDLRFDPLSSWKARVFRPPFLPGTRRGANARLVPAIPKAMQWFARGCFRLWQIYKVFLTKSKTFIL